VKQQTLCDACRFGDFAGRDVVEVTDGEVLDCGFEKLAPAQFSLRLSLSRRSLVLVEARPLIIDLDATLAPCTATRTSRRRPSKRGYGFHPL
jgi:hypothetical protein